MIDIQREIFLKVQSLKREQDRERLSLKEGSSLLPLRQGRSLIAHIQLSIERDIGLHIHPLKNIKIGG